MTSCTLKLVQHTWSDASSSVTSITASTDGTAFCSLVMSFYFFLCCVPYLQKSPNMRACWGCRPCMPCLRLGTSQPLVAPWGASKGRPMFMAHHLHSTFMCSFVISESRTSKQLYTRCQDEQEAFFTSTAESCCQKAVLSCWTNHTSFKGVCKGCFQLALSWARTCLHC